MFIDLTYKISKQKLKDLNLSLKPELSGHLGTHFDVMDKEFPLDFLERKAIVFDVSNIRGRDIQTTDIDIKKVENDMFVGFCSGFIETVEYGSREYAKEHPQLSNELIDALLEKKVSIIGIDFAGVRRGKEHTKMDQYCADKNVFIVENLCNFKSLLKDDKYVNFIANTYPLNYTDMSGLPCRVVAKI